MEIRRIERAPLNDEVTKATDFEKGNEGLFKVLENKQSQIDYIKTKIKVLEKDNDKLDRKGLANSVEQLDFEFDLNGKSKFQSSYPVKSKMTHFK